MVDIHSHLIFDVDDGAPDIETSEEIIRDEASQGVTHIIATPHYRRGMFSYPKAVIDERYEILKDKALLYGVKLFCGCEFHIHQDVVGYIRSGRVHSMGDGKYVLAEYSHDTGYDYIRRSVEELLLSGLYPVIAHAERYECFQRKHGLLTDLRAMGAMIQINAGSVLGEEGWVQKSLCRKAIKDNLADIIASDVHDMKDRRSLMRRCFEVVERKYGAGKASMLFEKCPMLIIKQITGEKSGGR